MKRGCVTCDHAAFERTPTGRIMRKVAGKCTYPIELPPLPANTTITTHRLGIWPDSHENCPTWKPKSP